MKPKMLGIAALIACFSFSASADEGAIIEQIGSWNSATINQQGPDGRRDFGGRRRPVESLTARGPLQQLEVERDPQRAAVQFGERLTENPHGRLAFAFLPQQLGRYRSLT
jgi:hypothetical protein